MDWLSELSFLSREDLLAELIWARLNQLKIYKTKEKLKEDNLQLQGINRNTQIHLIETQEKMRGYAASSVLLSRAMSEIQEPRLRLLKILRDPDSDYILKTISSNYQIPLIDFDSDLHKLELIVEFTRLGKLKLERGAFILTDDGNKMLEDLGYKINQ